jgi:hypothetical protein
MGGKGMKYVNAFYIAVILFIVVGISAMAYPENTIGIVNNAITIVQTSILSVGTSKLDTNNNIPEFPKVALPMATVIGLVFLFHIKRQKKENNPE